MNPFKPGMPVDPEYFGGRAQEQDTFETSLRYSIAGNPHHLAIIGERGIGKSSLLRKFEQLALQRDCMVVRRELDPTVDSIASLVMFILEALESQGASHMPRTLAAKRKIGAFFLKYKLGVSVMGHGFSIEKLSTSAAFQDYFYKELLHVWNGVRDATSGIVFLLDEAEKLQSIVGAWSFLRSVFTRVSEHNAGYMLVVSGKLGLFKGIKEIFSPMERFFIPIEVKPMTLDEAADALKKPLAKFSRQISDGAIQMIHHWSGGHPYVVQTFGFHAFEEGASEIDAKLIEGLLPRVISRLSTQMFKDRLEETSQQERKVLLAMSKLGRQASPKEIGEAAHLPQAVRVILRRLVDKDCVIKTGRGDYELFNPLFGEYVRSVVTG